MALSPCEVPVRTQVADVANDVLLLAADSASVGAAIQNDSSGVLLVGLGTETVTTTSYTVKLVQNAYYETPYRYNGQIRGLWLTDPGDGGARVTKFPV